MITITLIAIAACLVIFLLLVASRPSHFRIARSARMAAPASTVFAHVNDPHLFQEWSPWAKKEPTAETNYEGPQAGVGAAFAWKGKKVGQGRMTVVESRPNELVRFRLEFLKPFQVTNVAEFTFQSEGDATHVTWSMSGESRFLCKAIGLFINMDDMCGRDFAEGLENLRLIAESEAGVHTSNKRQPRSENVTLPLAPIGTPAHQH